MKRIEIQILRKQILLIMLSWLPIYGMGQSSGVDEIMKKYDSTVKSSNIGLAVMMKKNGEIETGSIGKYNFDEKSVFSIGSNTKTMTAVLILQEMEKGNLSLSDTIGAYLDPIKNVDGQLTIDHLLRHTSGLGEYTNEYFLSYFYSKRDSVYSSNFLDLIGPASEDERGEFHYCNTNYFLLGRILEKVTDIAYEDLLRERIFKPCNMLSSYPYLHKSIPNLAALTIHGEDVTEHINHKFYKDFAFSAGSVASTLEDMMLFYEHLYLKQTLIQKSSFDLLTDFGDGEYGMGMFINDHDGTKYIGHGGNTAGAAYRNYFDPITKNMILIFGNDMHVQIEPLIMSEIHDYMQEGIIHDEFDKNTYKIFKNVKGKYVMDEFNMEIEIKEKDKQLFFSGQGLEVELLSLNKSKLVVAQYGIVIERVEGSEDLEFHQSGYTLKLAKQSE